MKKITPILLVLLTFFSCSQKTSYKLSSPNEKVQIKVSDKNKSCVFSLLWNNDTIINHSQLGLQVNETSYVENVSLKKMSEHEFDETYTTVNGKQPTVRNHYNEYVFEVAKNDKPALKYEIVFRVYNDGFAYRYKLSSATEKNELKIEKELTSLNFNDDFTYWAYNGERHNLGPIVRSENNIDKVQIPFVLQRNNKHFMAIHEAEIVDFAPFSINASANNGALAFNTDYSARSNKFQTSWRAFILGDKVGNLVESNLIENLNEPCKIKDVSWIKPGKTMWDWRVWGYKTADGYTYGLNTESHKRFIDFAAQNNIQYLLIDADWYGEEFSENSNPTTAREGINIEDCMAYAAKKGVGIILYLNDVGAKKFGLERVLKQFSEWGAVGVKYGFMKGTPEEKAKHTRRVIELCAKYKLSVDFHDGPIAPNGEQRTYPNLMAKEYGHAQADAKRSYYPETAVNQPLINMIAGPLDLTNGWFDLNNAQSRVRVFKEIPGTAVAEVAKLITIYSGWMVLPDSPEEYAKKDDLFECIRRMPPQFDGFKVLDAQLDGYVSIARKAGDNWFIGSLTNREERTITLNLNFLPKGKKYEATIYSDADDSHFLNNKESYIISQKTIDNATSITVHLGAGGGNVLYLKQINNQ